MKTLALNTYIDFADALNINSESELHDLVSSIVNGLDDELFLVLYTVCNIHYTGFSVITPKSGDRVRSGSMAQLAMENGADSAIVFHMIPSQSSLMRECRILSEIDNTFSENSLTLVDYFTLLDGKFTSFQDTKI